MKKTQLDFVNIQDSCVKEYVLQSQGEKKCKERPDEHILKPQVYREKSSCLSAAPLPTARICSRDWSHQGGPVWAGSQEGSTRPPPPLQISPGKISVPVPAGASCGTAPLYLLAPQIQEKVAGPLYKKIRLKQLLQSHMPVTNQSCLNVHANSLLAHPSQELKFILLSLVRNFSPSALLIFGAG